ncbi:hypothetical protein M9H77_20881 [Catharanthus roseus]|uniref:Uncharacterized protein n=1 Tax=Catharanthus roseus TaxID=4058 RepID=A0ACC0AKS8_CATRO|nr:hypothetical protein M9H77_20881 [Catharanthus roseus]
MSDTKSSFHLALAVSNIKIHVPITLAMENVQYANWVELFKIHCRSHRILHHIIPPRPKDDRLRALFQDNEHSRAIALEEEFTSTYLRNFSSVSTYCQHLVDQLKNVRALVSNHRLVPLMSILALEEAGLKQATADGDEAMVVASRNSDESSISRPPKSCTKNRNK